MKTLDTLSYKTVLKAVYNWPPSRRFTLAQEILKSLTLETSTETIRPYRNTLEKALGLLSTGQSAPSDEKIQQWLDEQRMAKYK